MTHVLTGYHEVVRLFYKRLPDEVLQRILNSPNPDVVMPTWYNPNKSQEISLKRALDLNAALYAQTGENALLPLVAMVGADNTVDLNTAMMATGALFGALQSSIVTAMDPDSPGGVKLTAAERRECLQRLDEFERKATMIRGALEGAD